MNKQQEEIIKRALTKLQEITDEIKKLQQKEETPTPQQQEEEPQNLGPTPDINDPNWPPAVDPKMIVPQDNDNTKKFRALQISNHIHQAGTKNQKPLAPLTTQNILDYGCGEGHTTQELATTAHHITGYDTTPHKNWQQPTKTKNITFTTNPQDIQTNGPYNLIIIYDVLDHITTENPATTLKNLANQLAPNGAIYIRTHPWTSRTGSHHYETQNHNKAYIHLALTPQEIPPPPTPNNKTTRPIATYEQWIQQANLNITHKTTKTTPLEPYITEHLLNRIIKNTWPKGITPETAQKILQTTHIDYILTKKPE